MELGKNTHILIVGLGLMGGSYAIALKKKGYRIECITLDRGSVDYALEKGIIDFGTTEPDPEVIGRADLVIFALYPHVFTEWIEKNQKYLKKGAFITDVTGIKGAIVGKIQSILRPDIEFIPSHPMTGREKNGVRYSTDETFGESNFIVTPTEKNTEEGIKLAEDLGKELGFARISVLSPEEHDEIIAFVSQLAHCLAITLMTCNRLEKLEYYTGNSFRDLTRIAHINEDMWTELFLLNRNSLLNEMELFEKQFDKLKKALEDEDTETMKEMMRKSTERRDIFDEIKN